MTKIALFLSFRSDFDGIYSDFSLFVVILMVFKL